MWRMLRWYVAAGLAVLLSHFRFRLAKEVRLHDLSGCCFCMLPCIPAPNMYSQEKNIYHGFWL